MLAEVPPSLDVQEDLRKWRPDRLMAHYKAVKPWCELILSRMMPMAVLGEQAGLSFLFPMEKLFERYVAAWLRKQVRASTWIRTPAASESLCIHDGQPKFQLEPDVLIGEENRRWILDMKWKRVDSSDAKNKYRLDQGDFYQMFAYGHKYMQGEGVMALIYPRSASFRWPLAPFHFSGGLRLEVWPFDLDDDRLMGWEGTDLPLRQQYVKHGLTAVA